MEPLVYVTYAPVISFLSTCLNNMAPVGQRIRHFNNLLINSGKNKHGKWAGYGLKMGPGTLNTSSHVSQSLVYLIRNEFN